VVPCRRVGPAHDRRGLPAGRRGGVGASVLRGARAYPLRAGGLGPPPLSASGAAAHRVHVFAQRIGLALDEIGAELAKLPPDRAPTRRDWSRLSRGWTARIDAQIAELERVKLGLTECIGCGCLSLDRCQLANPQDRAARFGPGPRYWIGDRPLGA
jgi:MerR family transcriptional regulator, redox-sensitive transcriptional activator SoxR